MSIDTNSIEWKTIPDFPNYEASSDGRIRRVPGRGAKTYRSIAMSLSGNGVRYLHVVLSKDGKVYGRYVHKLVVEAFIGPVPKGLTVNHKDGDRFNNSESNLEIMTYSENILHSYRVLGRKGPNRPCDLVRDPKTGRILAVKRLVRSAPH